MYYIRNAPKISFALPRRISSGKRISLSLALYICLLCFLFLMAFSALPGKIVSRWWRERERRYWKMLEFCAVMKRETMFIYNRYYCWVEFLSWTRVRFWIYPELIACARTRQWPLLPSAFRIFNQENFDWKFQSFMKWRCSRPQQRAYKSELTESVLGTIYIVADGICIYAQNRSAFSFLRVSGFA